MFSFLANNIGHLITLATTVTVGAITTYIVTSHTTTASIPSDKKIEAIDKRIEVLDTRVANVEKDVTMQNTELRVLEEMSYGLVRASAGEESFEGSHEGL